MNAVPGRRPAVRTLALAAGLALALTGCGASLDAQTYAERVPGDSTNASFGAVQVRDLQILAPEGIGTATYERGSDALVALYVVNSGEQADRLVSASSPVASSVAIVSEDGSPATLAVPARGTVGDVFLELRGLDRELRTGEFVPMELVFERGGSEQVSVPVDLTGVPGPRREGYEVAHTDSNGDVVHSEEEHADEEHSGEEKAGDEHGGEEKAAG